jgi:hypothetical protein
LELLGFKIIPEDPCIFVYLDIIIFFYINDIIIFFYPDKEKEIDKLEKHIKLYWEIYDIGEIS